MIKLMAKNDENIFSVFDNAKDLENITKDNPNFFNKIEISIEYDFSSNPDRRLEVDEWFFLAFDTADFVINDIEKMLQTIDNGASFNTLNSKKL